MALGQASGVSAEAGILAVVASRDGNPPGLAVGPLPEGGTKAAKTIGLALVPSECTTRDRSTEAPSKAGQWRLCDKDEARKGRALLSQMDAAFLASYVVHATPAGVNLFDSPPADVFRRVPGSGDRPSALSPTGV
jgi:hypothetical protein